MKKSVKFFALASVLLITLTLPACGDSSFYAPSSESGLRIGIVTSSGVDDGSFGQECYLGILGFTSTHEDSSVNHVKEPDMGKMIQAVSDIIADYDVMVLPGFQFNNVTPVALANPDKMFILVDTFPIDAEGEVIELNNVYAMQFKEQESGFFAGVAAALETKTGKVAVVSGMPFPPVVNYQYGFMAGVNYANAHLNASATYVELPSYAASDMFGNNVGGNYVGSFADQATGKVIGNALINEGVDRFFVAAGDSGNGVFVAVKEASNDIYVIGVDLDQYDDGETGTRNIVLTSGTRKIAMNITRQLENMYNGTFRGENALLDASSDSTGYVSQPGRHQMSDRTLRELEKVYNAVKYGEIIPPGQFTGDSVPTNFPGL